MEPNYSPDATAVNDLVRAISDMQAQVDRCLKQVGDRCENDLQLTLEGIGSQMASLLEDFGITPANAEYAE
jgi:hypothetical protein